MTGIVGELIGGRYRLIEVVGQGGMGRVWLAEDEVLNRRVAVKQVLLAPELPSDERSRLIRRTQVEAEATARLRHPGVVTIHDVVDHVGAPWIVMEHLPGPSLAALITQRGRLDWPQVAALATQVAEALAHAHTSGIVHRDLKPDNILLDGDRAVLTDFGIARILDSISTLTSTRTVIGTPQYMPPEQLEGRRVQASGDLWSLGATLYAAVEGQPPYTGTSLIAIITSILTRPLPPPAHAGSLTGIITDLLTRDADSRPTAAETARRMRTLDTAPQTEPARPDPGTLPKAEAARLAGNQATTPMPPPTRPSTGRTSAGSGQRELRPNATPVTQPPYARRPLTRRFFLGGTLGAVAVAGGLAALLTYEDKSNQHGSSSSLGSSSPTGSATPTSRIAFTALSGHTNEVHSVTFSPDGRTLATGSNDGTARLWDVATGTSATTLADPDHAGVQVAFSPIGKTLATGSNTARLWDVATGRTIDTLTGHTNLVYGVAFSSDGKTVGIGYSDNTARLWNVVTGKATTLTGHTDTVYSVAFSPDGKTLATGSADQTARLWSVATGQITKTFGGHTSGVTSVAFSLDGRTFSTGSNDGTVKLWNVDTGTIGTMLTGHTGSVFSVAFSPNGKSLATGNGNNTATLWNVATGKAGTILAGHTNEVYSVAFSPDGRTLATGSLDSTARLWHLG
ncbi:serine/threonine-protein kinase [Streptomyces sp. NPDC052000]|uniref:WD40 repeat domain-containing serine/threonine protein kinase n=1 Tax=Streptomyces sp. NPDC052000 TaxID=3155676 RepID=UPI00344EF1A2